jgi:DNA-binding response OmpR family regulator
VRNVSEEKFAFPGKGEVHGMGKVLVVDDAPVIRLLLARVFETLRKDGVELLFAEDGYEALRIVEQEHPRVVFLDVMMLGKNGFDVCHTIKKVWKMEDVHVALLTAKCQDSDRRKGAEAGANEYITKPFDPDDLLARVKLILGIP